MASFFNLNRVKYYSDIIHCLLIKIFCSNLNLASPYVKYSICTPKIFLGNFMKASYSYWPWYHSHDGKHPPLLCSNMVGTLLDDNLVTFQIG